MWASRDRKRANRAVANTSAGTAFSIAASTTQRDRRTIWSSFQSAHLPVAERTAARVAKSKEDALSSQSLQSPCCFRWCLQIVSTCVAAVSNRNEKRLDQGYAAQRIRPMSMNCHSKAAESHEATAELHRAAAKNHEQGEHGACHHQSTQAHANSEAAHNL